MSQWSARVHVANWEFRRFVKPNQMMLSFVIMMLMGGVGFFVGRVAQRAKTAAVNVALVGGDALALSSREKAGNLSLVAAPSSALDSLRKALASRTLDGILVVRGTDSATLIVRRNPVWRSTLEAHLSAARRRLNLQRSGLPPERLASMLAPVAVATEFQSGTDGRAARLVAIFSIALVLYGVFSSMAYMLASVTGEKQLRVTEQVISAISPQTWIDGKILGISAVALVNVLLFMAGGMIWILGRSIATGSAFTIGSAEPAAIIWIIVFALLGFVFWLSLFGAIAATIDDPNTSTRGPIMFLPALFASVGFMVIRNPDSTFARVASYIPLTSSSVMPARIALSEVPIADLVISAALLLGGAALSRRAAGKVFAVAMLMYGKEPSWGEMRRWIRES